MRRSSSNLDRVLLFALLPCGTAHTLYAMTLDQIGKKIRNNLERLGANRAILFGSYARGTEDTRSDIDLLIIDNRDEPYLDRIERYFRPLAESLPQPIEILVYTSDELERAKNRPFIARVLREGIEIYERREAPTRS